MINSKLDNALEILDIVKYLRLPITAKPSEESKWEEMSKIPLPEDFIRDFNQGNAMGLEKIDEIVAANPYPLYDLKKYYKLHLSYQLDEAKIKGMQRFLEVIKDL